MVRRSWVYCIYRWNGSQHTMKPDILARNRYFYLAHLHSTPSLGGSPSEYCHNVWYRKTSMVRLLDGETILQMFIRFDRIYERARQAHTYTDAAWRHRPRLHSTSRQKLRNFIMLPQNTRIGGYSQYALEWTLEYVQFQRRRCHMTARCLKLSSFLKYMFIPLNRVTVNFMTPTHMKRSSCRPDVVK